MVSLTGVDDDNGYESDVPIFTREKTFKNQKGGVSKHVLNNLFKLHKELIKAVRGFGSYLKELSKTGSGLWRNQGESETPEITLQVVLSCSEC